MPEKPGYAASLRGRLSNVAAHFQVDSPEHERFAWPYPHRRIAPPRGTPPYPAQGPGCSRTILLQRPFPEPRHLVPPRLSTPHTWTAVVRPGTKLASGKWKSAGLPDPQPEPAAWRPRPARPKPRPWESSDAHLPQSDPCPVARGSPE